MIGYPFVPAVFILAATYLVVNALINDPKWTSITFGVVLAGLPVYYAVFRNRAAATAAMMGSVFSCQFSSAKGNVRLTRARAIGAGPLGQADLGAVVRMASVVASPLSAWVKTFATGSRQRRRSCR